jgi:hypothetical protein
VLLAPLAETSATFAYTFQTSDFAATGNLMHALAGNGPILVSKVNGAVVVAGTALPIKEYIREFEVKNAMSA